MKTFSMTRRRLIGTGAAFGALVAMPALAELQISIVGVGANQLPIAVRIFEGTSAATVSMSEIIGSDLERCGAFRLIATGAETAGEAPAKPESFAQWVEAGANALVTGMITRLADGRWDVRYWLQDPVSGETVDEAAYVSTDATLRMTAHRFADRIYTRLTGEGAIFASQLVYVAQLAKNHFQLVVADSDGANPRIAVNSHEPIISPAWSSDGKRIAYVSFEAQKPVVYVQDLATGSRRAISAFQGNNSAPAFSADGTKLAVALSRDGLTQIYMMNANGTGLRRFTQSYGIDTEPVFSRDGKYIYFTSDRGGSPQIYRQSLEAGSHAERVTFGSSYAISPDVSPDGKYLTYVSRIEGSFRIAVMDLQTGQSTLVTRTARDESPSFAPNGRFVVYATEENGRGVLGTASADGRLSTRLTGKGNIREPSWGPVLI